MAKTSQKDRQHFDADGLQRSEQTRDDEELPIIAHANVTQMQCCLRSHKEKSLADICKQVGQNSSAARRTDAKGRVAQHLARIVYIAIIQAACRAHHFGTKSAVNLQGAKHCHSLADGQCTKSDLKQCFVPD